MPSFVPTPDRVLPTLCRVGRGWSGLGAVRAVACALEGSETPDLSAASNMKAGRVVVGGSSEEQVRERLLALAGWFSDSVVVQAADPA